MIRNFIFCITFCITTSILFAQVPNIVQGKYWFDNNYSDTVILAIPPVPIKNFDQNISTAGLSTGFHVFHFIAKDSNGKYSSPISTTFLKNSAEIVKMEYWFDGNYAQRETVMTNGTLDSNFNVSSLQTGMHYFNYRFQSQNGLWSSPASQMFLKLTEPNRIVAYRYWFDSAFDSVVNVPIGPISNPYTLDFTLDTNDLSGLVGDHVIHFQFRDTSGLWSAPLQDTFSTVYSGTTAISGTVKDAIINSSQINYNPLSGCTVRLYSAGTNNIIQTVSTNTSGQFSFYNLSQNVYDIEAIYTDGSYTYKTRENNISVNSLNILLKISATIISQVQVYNDSLYDLNCYISSVGQHYDVPSYFITQSEIYLSNSKVIVGNDDDIIESIARLYIAERAIKQYFSQASTMNNEYVADILVAMKSALSMYRLYSFSQASLISGVVKQTTKAFVALIIKLSENSFSKLPDDEEHLLQIQLGIQKDLMYAQAFGGSVIGPNTFMDILAYPIASIFSDIILESQTKNTQPTFNSSVFQSNSNFYSGTYTNHFSQVSTETALSNSMTAYSQAYAESLRGDAEANVIDDILDVLNASTAGSIPLLAFAGLAAHSYDIIVLGSSMNQCSKRLNSLVGETNETASLSYIPSVPPIYNNYDTTLYQLISASTDTIISDFQIKLTNTIADINSGNTATYQDHLVQLLSLNEDLNSGINEEILTIQSALPYLSITNVDSLFLNDLKNTLFISTGYRSGFLLALAALIDSPTNNAIIDTLNSFFPQTINSNSLIHTEATNFETLLSGITQPASIAIYESEMPLEMQSLTTVPVTIRFRNYGSTDANNVFIKLNSGGLFTFSIDSFNRGTLNPGEKDSIEVMVSSVSSIDSIGTYNIIFGADSLDYLAVGGAIYNHVDTTTFINHISSYSSFNLNPNPNCGSFIITSNMGFENNEIEIVNSIGQTVFNKIIKGNDKAISINIEQFADGVYFVKNFSKKGVEIKRFVINK